MAGKYMPMAISRSRKARKETTVSMLVAPGRVVTQQIAIVVAIMSRQFWGGLCWNGLFLWQK